MGILKEFREFAMRGNVVDMAVGVIMGAAFGKIVTSLVSDVLMPPIGKLVGNLDFKELILPLESTKVVDGVTVAITTLTEAKKHSVPYIGYGLFLNTVIDFVIVALCIFAVIKAMNTLKKMQKKEEPAPPSTRECPLCCSTINVKAKRCPQCTAEITVA